MRRLTGFLLRTIDFLALILVDQTDRTLASAWPSTVDELLAVYDFPAEHWKHLRTTNSIESVFATMRLYHRRARQRLTGSLPRDGSPADTLGQQSQVLYSPTESIFRKSSSDQT
jgi:transposase-like protein